MKTVRLLILAVVMFAAGVFAGPKVARGPFPIGMGKTKPGLMMASSTGATTPTVDWSVVCFEKSGNATVNIVYTTPGGSRLQGGLVLDSGCTHVTSTLNGSTVYTTSGGADAVCTLDTNVVTQMNTLIANAASGGKLNL